MNTPNNKPTAIPLVVLVTILAYGAWDLSYDCGARDYSSWSLVSHASASDDLWNFGAVLTKGKKNFRRLCASENGTIETPSSSALKCTGTRGADVSALFTNGRATVFGMMWDNNSAGLEMLDALRSGFGREDLVEKIDGCRMYMWANPAGDGISYSIGLCSGGSYALVGDL